MVERTPTSVRGTTLIGADANVRTRVLTIVIRGCPIVERHANPDGGARTDGVGTANGASDVKADRAFLESTVLTALRLREASCPELERIGCSPCGRLRIEKKAIHIPSRRSLDEIRKLLTGVAELLEGILARVRRWQRVVDSHVLEDEAHRADEHRCERCSQRVGGP